MSSIHFERPKASPNGYVPAGTPAAYANGAGEALTSSIDHMKNLAGAYQAILTKNAERMTSSIQQLASVKSPIEFIELQQKLLAGSMESAMADGTHLARLSAAMFMSAFQPMQAHIASLQSATKV